MDAPTAVLVAVSLVWLGMVLAISFLEAPLKFRAPNVTPQIGLGIGRLVFRALNAAEVLFAVVALVALVLFPPTGRIITSVLVAVGTLLVQLVAVRPRLSRRSDAVLAGRDAPRSRAHHAYIALEVAKVAALVLTGTWLLSA
ncbi:hypothetical protein EIL87_17225 [Saccharopolyspora rhizosphaerae]|uniref:DUF4149 domain-containing protein n=2 Tax=Saccharopolyspora rhizosphaerae TaxID=2492662 RepID=A0A426JRJ1_9PSEU|nr:hypothetical protein EIL87_17225 [Saccharopolyspora rhizosphaerae]